MTSFRFRSFDCEKNTLATGDNTVYLNGIDDRAGFVKIAKLLRSV